jgi:transcriptional regulator with XRE-family HTH domain
MAEMYGATLFEMLERFGITRQELVKRLGADRSSAWLWAQGTRSIAMPYRRPIALIVREKLAQVDAEADAARKDPTYPRSNTLLSAKFPPAVERALQLRQMLEKWVMEQIDKAGEANARIQRHGRVLGELQYLEANKLSAEELDRYMWTLNDARRYLRLIMSRRGISLPSDPAFMGDYVHYDDYETLVQRFTSICRQLGVELDEGGGGI